jgi:prevent-host-death family protein
MKTVNIAELKDKLSAYLEEVEKGEEILIINRKKPVARVTRVSPEEQDQEEWDLIAEGKLKLPEKNLSAAYLKRFLSARKPEVQAGSTLDALSADRDHETR